MRRIGFALVLPLLLAGCGTHQKLPAQQPADRVRITTLAGFPNLPLREIREKERVAALVAFVNSLPNKWSIPWYGPPVGRVYFEFVSARRTAGNFYVGPEFFGRDTDRHYSQDASREKIVELGKIAGVDLWGYVNGRSPGQPPAPAAAPVTPTAPVAPAAQQPTSHP
jgi:hypothetical protein